MTITSKPVKSVDYHPDESEPPVANSVNAYFEKPCLLPPESGETTEETEHHNVADWLISLAALAFLVLGFLCIVESGIPRATDANQERLTTEGMASQTAVTFDEAMRGAYR
jgi:hypothetical protein